MPNSYQKFNGDAVTTDFTFTFDYISSDHIVVTVDDVATTAFTFLAAKQIRFTTAPGTGTDNIKVSRSTPTSALTDFVDGSTLGEADLDRVLLQALFVAEEATDLLADSTDTIQKASGNWNASSLQIKNLASASVASDATNRQDVLDILSGSAGITSPTTPGEDNYVLTANSGSFTWQPVNVTSITASQISDASADGRSILTAANLAAVRTLLGLVIGTDVQAYDVDTAKTDTTRAWTKLQYFTPITGPASGAASPDWTNGNVVHSTLTGNITSVAAPAGISDGASVKWILQQDGTGGQTIASFNAAYKFKAGTAPTLSTTANAYDILIIERVGSNYLVSFDGDYQ